MKVLVTGGTGYIGSHTVAELQDNGFDVVIADNLSNSSVNVVDAIEKICGKRPVFEMCELCNENEVKDLFLRHADIESIIHFAAFKAVGESSENPLKYYHNNLFSLINLLKCMKGSKAGKLVFSSSCTVYGEPESLPVDENFPVKKPVSPYGNTKKISEEIIYDLVTTSDLHAISLRYFNPIGAHESGLIGELPLGIPNNLVPFITQTAIGKREYLRVFGNDYNTHDGTCIRDYIHVVDLAKAHVHALKRMVSGNMENPFETFNLATGKGYSVLEVIRSFEKVSGLKLNYSFCQRRQGDVEQIWADAGMAQQKLGWKAEKSLDDMMLSSWKWEQKLSEKIKTKNNE